MNGYNFTDHVRGALQAARQEATRLHHEYVGTEHLLLGLLCIPDCTAVKLLLMLHVDLTDLKANIEGTVKQGAPTRARESDLPYTSRAKKILELAMGAARDLRDSDVGTSHVLLGIAQEERGLAALTLVQAGITVTALRSTIEASRGIAHGDSDRDLDRPVTYTLVADFADGRQETQRFSHATDVMKHLARWISRS